MSFLDLFRPEEAAIREKLTQLRKEFPSADLDARMEGDLLVVSGTAESHEDRRSILDSFRALNVDFTPLVGGRLKVPERPPEGDSAFRARQARNLTPKQKADLSTRTTKRMYRVQQDDTLDRIAKKFYGRSGAGSIVAAANAELICGPDSLHAGCMLEIPETFIYSVRSGDSLESIAKHFYGETRQVQTILLANADQLDSESKLETGFRLRIPLCLGTDH